MPSIWLCPQRFGEWHDLARLLHQAFHSAAEYIVTKAQVLWHSIRHRGEPNDDIEDEEAEEQDEEEKRKKKI